MSNKKKKFLGLMTAIVVTLGAVGTGFFSIFSKNNNNYNVEEDLVTAAKKYIQNKNIAIDDSLTLRKNLLVDEGVLNGSDSYGELSSVTITNTNGSYTYKVSNANANADTISGTAKLPFLPPSTPEIEYSVSQDTTTTKSVTVTITFTEQVYIAGISTSELHEDDAPRRWSEDVNGNNVTVLTTTFEHNGSDVITYESNSFNGVRSLTVSVSNIDKEPVNVTLNDKAPIEYYSDNVKIDFNKGTATLNGEEIQSGKVTDTDGKFTLVVKYADAEDLEYVFYVYKNGPISTTIENGAHYKDPVSIEFGPDVDTAVLVKKPEGTRTEINSGFIIGNTKDEEGEYVLILTNPAGITNEIEFTIDKTDPEKVSFAPIDNTPTTGSVTLELKVSEGVKITNRDELASLGIKVLPNETDENGKTLYTDTYTFEVDTPNLEVTVKFEDQSGRTGEASTTVTNIDRQGPRAEITFSENNPTNKSVIITLVTDEELLSAPICEGLNFVLDTNDTKNLTYKAETNENVTCTVTLEDKLHNKGTTNLTNDSIIINNIDKNKPVIGIKDMTNVISGNAYNVNEIILTYSDENKIKSATLKRNSEEAVDYTFNYENNSENNNVIALGSKITKEGNYVLTVTDLADNEITFEFSIDRTAPVVKANNKTLKDGTHTFFNKEVVLTVTDLTDYEVLLDGEKFDINNKISEEKLHTLTVTDKANNKTELTFTIDTVKPNIKIDAETNKEVITFNKNIPTNEKPVEITFTFNKPVEITNMNDINGFVSYTDTDTHHDYAKVTVEANGKITFKLKDQAGNTNSYTYNFTGIDTNLPKITLKEGETNQKVYGENTILQPVYTDKNEIANVSLTKNGEEIGYTFGENTSDKNVIKKGTTTITEEGKYVLTVTDIAGNTRVVKFTIDYTKPIVILNTDRIDSDDLEAKEYFYNKDVTIKFSDATPITVAKLENITTGEVKEDIKTKDVIVTPDNSYNEYKLTITDSANQTRTIKFIIDKELPIQNSVTLIGKDSDGNDITLTDDILTNKDITVKFVISEPVKLTSDDETKEYRTEFEVIATKNGKVSINVVDKAGNTNEISYQIVNVDKTRPVITITDKDGNTHTSSFVEEIEWGTYTNEAPYQIPSAVATDNGSEIAVTTKITSTKDLDTELSSIDTNKSGSYYVTYTATDGINVKTVRVTIKVLDKTAPKLSIEVPNYVPNKWFNQNVEVLLNAEELGSGIKSYEYKIITKNKETGEDIIPETWSKAKKKEDGTYSFFITTNSDNIRFVVRATDKANNISEEISSISALKEQVCKEDLTCVENTDGIIKLDKTAPSLSAKIRTKIGTNDWYNKDIIVDVTSKDSLSGIDASSLNYQLTLNDTPVTGKITDMEVISESEDGKTVVKRFTITLDSLKVDENVLANAENIGYIISVKDNAENVKEITEANKLKLDTTLPTVIKQILIPSLEDLAPTNGLTNNEVIVRFTMSEAGTLTEFAEDSLVYQYELAKNEDGSIIPNTFDVKFKKNGTKKVTFTDNAGNKVVVPLEVSNIDKTKPTITFDSSIDPETLTINLNLNDVFVVPTPTVSDNLDTTVTGTINPVKQTVPVDEEGRVTTPGTYKLKYQVSDIVGNTRVVYLTVNVMDNQAPEITFDVTSETTPAPTQGGWHTKPLQVTINAKDVSGITNIQYKVITTDENGNEIIPNEWITVDENSNGWNKISDTESSYTFTIKDDNAGIRIIALSTDNSENKNKTDENNPATSEIYKLDTTGATIKTTLTPSKPNEYGYYTNVIELKTEIIGSLSGIASFEYAINYGNGDSEYKSVPEDGIILIDTESEEITYTIRAIDNAGNRIYSTNEGKVLKLDMTKPYVLTESIEPKDLDTLTNQSITLTFLMSEPVTFIKEDGYVKPTEETVTNEDGTEVIKYSLTFDKNGTKKVKFMDKAGLENEHSFEISNIDSTSPTIKFPEINDPNTGKPYEFTGTNESNILEIETGLNQPFTLPNTEITDNSEKEIEKTIPTVSEVNTAVEGVYSLTYKAKDEAQNETIVVLKVKVIDLSAPTINDIIISNNLNNLAVDNWYNTPLNVTLSATDPSGIKSFSYKVITTDENGNEIIPDKWTTVDENSEGWNKISDTESQYNFVIDIENKGIRVIALATDGSTKENTTQEESAKTSEVYKVDLTKPSEPKVTFEGTVGKNDFYTSDITVNVELNDILSGMKDVYYKYSTSVDESGNIIWPVAFNKFENANGGSFTISGDSSTIYYRITGYDKAGNMRTITSSKPLKIDTTSPELIDFSNTKIIDITQDENKGVEYNPLEGINPSDVNLGENPVTYEITNAKGEKVEKVDTNKTGSYRITYTVTDLAGNTNEVEYIRVVNVIDKSSIDELLDEINNNLRPNEDKYTPESWDNLEDTIIEVGGMPDSTQEEIEEIIEKLEEAIKNLVEIPTASIENVETTDNKTYVKVGDKITLTFTSNVELDLDKTIVSIAGSNVKATLVKDETKKYKAELTVSETTQEGEVIYSITPIYVKNEVEVKGDVVNTSPEKMVVVDTTSPELIDFINAKIIDITQDENKGVEYNPLEGINPSDVNLGENPVTYEITNAKGEKVESVNTNTTGSYIITYTVTDLAGNTNKVEYVRTVNVIDKSSIDALLNEINNNLRPNKDKYTTESWDNLENTIIEIGGMPDSTQEEIEKIVDKLMEAMNNLVEVPTVSIENVETTDNKTYVKVGDSIALTFTSNVALDLDKTIVTIAGSNVKATKVKDEARKYIANLTVSETTQEGEVIYSITPIYVKNEVEIKGDVVNTSPEKMVVVDTTSPELIDFSNTKIIDITQDENKGVEYNPLEGINPSDVNLGENPVTYEITNAKGEKVEKVDTNKTGSYRITYTVTDLAGNTNEVEYIRVVNVIDKSSIDVLLNEINTNIIPNSSKYTESSYNKFIQDLEETLNMPETTQEEIEEKVEKLIEIMNSLVEIPTVTLESVETTDNKAYVKVGDKITLTFTSNVALNLDKTIVSIAGSNITATREKGVTNKYTAELTVTDKTVEGIVNYSVTPVYVKNDEEIKGAETTEISSVVIVDTTNPEIIFNNKNFTVDITNTPVDSYDLLSDVTATDTNLGTNVISVSGTVDTTTAGSYKVKYTVVDLAGNKTEIEKTVNVINKSDLNSIIDSIDKYLPNTDYTEDSWQKVEDAKDLPENTQEEIENKKDAIQDALDNLVTNKLDTSKLDKIESDLSSLLEKDEYAPSTLKPIQDAIKNIRDKIENGTLKKQSEFDKLVDQIPPFSTLIKIPNATNVSITGIDAQTGSNKPIVTNGDKIRVTFTSSVELDQTESLVIIEDVMASLISTTQNEDNTYTYTYEMTLNTNEEINKDVLYGIHMVGVITTTDASKLISETTDKVKIDTVKPTGELKNNNTSNPDDMTKDDVEFTLTTSKPVLITNQPENVTIEPLFENATDTTTTKFKVIVSSNIDNGTITFKDILGNTGSVEINVNNIDKVLPTISGINDKDVITDPSITVAPTFTKDGNHTLTATLNKEPWTSGQEITKDGNYTLTVTDEIGNKITYTFRIDKEAPTLTVKYNGEIVNDTLDIEFGSEFKGFEVTAKDTIDGDITNIETTGTVNTSLAEQQVVTFKVQDSAGHITTKVVTVNVRDTKNPTVKIKNIIGEKVSEKNEWYYKTPQLQVEFDGTDEGTGIKEYRYTVIYKEKSEPVTGVVSASSPIITITENSEEIIVKVKSIDNYGLESLEEATTTIKFDSTSPSNLTAAPTTSPNNNGWYTNPDGVTVKMSATDSMSGIDKLCYIINTDTEKWTKEEWTCLNGENNESTFVIKAESNNILYKVKAIDKAGNETNVIESDSLKMDTKAPVIKVNNNGKEETKDFNLTLEADKNGIYNVPTAVASDNIDKNIEVQVNGTVDLKVVNTPQKVTYTATDNAGNTSTVTLTVTVKDTTSPTLTLNGDKTVTIMYGSEYNDLGATVTDNLDENIEIKTKSNLNVFKPGTYEITYTATDKSGNTSTVKRTIIVEKTTTSDLFRKENSCENTGDCYNTKENDNYVWYSGRLWRVIKVNANNSVKLITEETQAGFSYNRRATDAELSSKTYTPSNFVGSNAQNWLKQEFYSSLKNANTLLVEDNYCNEPTNELFAERRTCSEANTVKSKFGLLTLDEFNILGGTESFVYTGDRFFTMTPKLAQTVFIVSDPNDADAIYSIRYKMYTDEPYGIRPVITMKSVNIAEGNGTKENPYRIEGDASGSKGSSLANRNTGEYVSFANRTWRIVEAENSGTKLIYDGFYTVKDELNRDVIDYQPYGTLTEFSTSKGIGKYLNTTVYNTLFTNKEKLVIEKTNWYNNKFKLGDSPSKTSLVSSSNKTEAYVGLIRVGELMSGGNLTNQPGEITSWTLNNTGSQAWYTTWRGTSDYLSKTSDDRAIRPVINLTASVKIASGDGTYNSPYKLQY